MSGNVEEWEDSCQKDADTGGGADACRSRGGSWSSARDATRCDAVPASAHKRLDHDPTLGFRCCG
jgi:formylglycine-generating enzyme required for sulfatase activity